MPGEGPKYPEWYAYFPTNYRWSAAMSGIIGASQAGGSDMGEIHQAGRNLLKATQGDDEAWFTEWSKLGDTLRTRAEAALAAGKKVTASDCFLRATTYYQFGERFRTHKDQRALDVYRTSVDCFHKFAELTDRVKIEAVEIPYPGGKALPAYFVHAKNNTAAKTPCLVYFDGFDITKEMQYIRAVPDLIRRGFSILVVDGPGNGESVRFRGIHLRHDHEVAGGAALDYLATRKDVDMSRVGVMGVSLGGYYAARNAAKEHRFSACVVWGAIWDYHQTWLNRRASNFTLSMSVRPDHLFFVLGVDTWEEAIKILEPFPLKDVLPELTCPLLILHGEHDEQIPLADAQAVYDHAGTKDKTLRIFTPDEGGGQHCQSDQPTIASATMGDWLQDKLGIAGAR